jgi:hypothetical protein
VDRLPSVCTESHPRQQSALASKVARKLQKVTRKQRHRTDRPFVCFIKARAVTLCASS